MSLVRGFSRLVAVIITCSLLTVVNIPFAQGDVEGGVWPRSSGQYVILGYTHDVLGMIGSQPPPQYAGILQGAATAWNATPTNVALYKWTPSPTADDPLVHVYEEPITQDEDWYAWTYNQPNPCGSGCSYDQSTMMINVHLVGGLSNFMRTKIIVHEFGHIFGLEHTTHSPSIMRQYPTQDLTYNIPQSYDINEINGLYS